MAWGLECGGLTKEVVGWGVWAWFACERLHTGKRQAISYLWEVTRP